MSDQPGAKQCPRCGRGELVDVLFIEGSPSERIGEEIQLSDTRQVEVYSCGHEVSGPRLDETAREEQLQVEHRQSEETTEPL